MSYIVKKEKKYCSIAGPLKTISIAALGLTLIVNSVNAGKYLPEDDQFNGSQLSIASLARDSKKVYPAVVDTAEGLADTLHNQTRHQVRNLDEQSKSFFHTMKEVFKGCLRWLMGKAGASENTVEAAHKVFGDSILKIHNSAGKDIHLKVYQLDDTTRERKVRAVRDLSKKMKDPWISTLEDLQLDLSKTFGVEISHSMCGILRKDLLEDLSCTPLSTELIVEATRSFGIKLCHTQA